MASCDADDLQSAARRGREQMRPGSRENDSLHPPEASAESYTGASRDKAPAEHSLRLIAGLETRAGADVTLLLGDLLEDTVRMQRLVDQLLLLARNDGAPPRPSRSVDLDDLVYEVAGDIATTRDVRIDLRGVEPVQLLGDPTLLEQVIRNLAETGLPKIMSTRGAECGV